VQTAYFKNKSPELMVAGTRGVIESLEKGRTPHELERKHFEDFFNLLSDSWKATAMVFLADKFKHPAFFFMIPEIRAARNDGYFTLDKLNGIPPYNHEENLREITELYDFTLRLKTSLEEKRAFKTRADLREKFLAFLKEFEKRYQTSLFPVSDTDD
jgi:hypothetical protein